MRIKPIHPAFIMPIKGSNHAGAYDIYMPEEGFADGIAKPFGLGFAAAVPAGHVALLLPRSSSGGKFGLELNNSCGVIDSDYRGEWKAMLRTKPSLPFTWNAGDRILQFLIVPVTQVDLELTDELDATERGTGGFGSTGQ
jgi:dUTP pyrophosphatase